MTGDPKPESSRKRPSDAEERESFKRRVLTMDAGECQVHEFATDCEGPLEAHHVITQQQLRHAGRHELLWSPRNGMTVCELAHTRHTKAVLRIPLSALPARALEFARDYGFGHLIDRYYPA